MPGLAAPTGEPSEKTEVRNEEAHRETDSRQPSRPVDVAPPDASRQLRATCIDGKGDAELLAEYQPGHYAQAHGVDQYPAMPRTGNPAVIS